MRDAARVTSAGPGGRVTEGASVRITAMPPSLERAFRDPVSAMSWFCYKIRPGRHDVRFSE
ncbi:hypothetical protein GCM10017567_51320 [Amycolatopsis bullii]|uniref:Uncharacterized protein n=1 Tax=Amycolatopsis bullii TaxID=941987 RepID=A0ABQ3KH52_9PSEU|nr:hypothetical protein GCM10017567_51320 [Amycolatopsis bullii]